MEKEFILTKNHEQYVAELDDIIDSDIRILLRDVVVVNKKKYPDRDVKDYDYKRSRGIIKEFTWMAKRRCKIALRNSDPNANVLITLTYPGVYPTNGLVVKEHLYKFKKYLRKLDIDYFWVLEFQKRGAPHFHFIVNKFVPMDEVKKVWFDIVGSGDLKHLDQGVEVEFARNTIKAKMYMLKYLEKSYSKDVPDEYKKVGRFWGHNKRMIIEVRRITRTFPRSVLNRNFRVFKRWAQANTFSLNKPKFQGSNWVFWDGAKLYNYCLGLIGVSLKEF